ncbi:hypothetical protein RHODO2019_18680 (plasmid) [Rhodococcus antarcticus]|uniref:DUF8175 domain-containing protein n=1 Tax=Rhodococcus antarcticus TaxID=2987751 RepID=A0ABY6P683_9NOCA|nr:hypothetical protein [Rhodococcus antarcticus]UZJ27018.1 hypothetical protein RHODO2019_18680 [Rhodococcus antarcticus]
MLGRRTTSRGEEPGSGLGPGWWAAAALMAVVVIALVGVLVVVGTRDKTTVAAGDPTTAPAAPSALPAPDGGGSPATTPPSGDTRPAGCATTGTDQTIPIDTPADVTWTLNKGLAVPMSPSDGPALRGPAGVAYCYSQTPVGAVLAATNLGRGTGTDAAVKAEQLKFSTVPGPLADAYAAEPVKPSDPAASAGVQFRGFRVISYSKDSASIALAGANAAQPGIYAVLTIALQWFQGDWRVVLQPQSGGVVTTTTTRSLDGFVAWSGVS